MRDSACLLHIRDASKKILRYTRGTKHVFLASDMAQDAVLRNIQIIGEAAKKLSESTRRRAPRTPWEQIAGMRNVVVHQYFGVDLTTVWNTAKKDIPKILRTVERLLRDGERVA